VSSVRASITIGRPIESVFAVLTDVEMTSRWFPWKVEEHWTSRPPHGVGSTRRAIIRMFGRRTENEAEVVEYKPPKRAVMRGTSPNAPFTATLDFVRKSTSTRVDVTIDLDFRGPARIVGPIFATLYRRAWKRGLANLKQLMETGAL
jgi:uncharacterized protein YndB with AHSA1/START domain